jgi:hypothetical protein
LTTNDLRPGVIFPALVVLFLALPKIADAADTVETWDVGATDVDYYLSFDGIGLGKKEKTVFGDLMLGYGLVDRFSAYLGTTLQANEYLTDGQANIYIGIFGTPVDTDHFDFDLFLDISLGGQDFDEFALSPALELNFDLDPMMRSWGMYLRIPMPIQGRKISSPVHPEPEGVEASFHLEGTIGTYYTVADGHQILLEYDMGIHPDPAQEERQVDIGTAALGYNVTLVDAIELINHFYLDIPQDNDPIAFGVMIGFIATLP